MTVGSSETMQAWVVSQPGPIETSPLRYVEKPNSLYTGWDADGGYAEYTTVPAPFGLSATSP